MRAGAGAFLDLVDRTLEPLVREGLDLPAIVADEVVMMLAAGLPCFETRATRPGVDPLDELVLDEQVEHAIDARHTDRPSGLAQSVM